MENRAMPSPGVFLSDVLLATPVWRRHQNPDPLSYAGREMQSLLLWGGSASGTKPKSHLEDNSIFTFKIPRQDDGRVVFSMGQERTKVSKNINPNWIGIHPVLGEATG